MQNLSLSDLFLGLGDLLREEAKNHRRASLLSTKSGRYYQEKLAKRYSDIVALPEKYRGGRPKSEELAEADHYHDGYGSAWQAVMRGYLRLPDLSPELRGQIESVLSTFGTDGLSEFKMAYADEARLAKERQPKLQEFETILRSFPVVGGKTLYDWVKSQIQYGISLDTLMSEQAKEEAEQGSREKAAALRSGTVGLLYRFRKELSEEIEEDKRSSTLETDIFGYFDELDKKRASSRQEKAKPSEPPKA